MITTAMNHSEPIDLGRQGENLARTIDIDISAWRAEFGEGTVQLLHQRQGDSTPYPVAVEQTGDVVRWAITSADTARVGYGAAQLLFFGAGDVLAKQCIYRTYVSSSLGQSAGEPPEAQQPWVERVLAEASKVTGMTARAVELPAGAEPTAEYADGILTIGIPLGGDVSEAQVAQAVADYLDAHPIKESDPSVPDWAKQPDKPSYSADDVGAIAQTELQAAIDTALAQAKASGAFDGDDGDPGPQGETGVGIQSVEQTTTSTEDGGTNVVTVTKTDGTSSTFVVRNGSTGPAGADGKDGATGADGQDGTTPTIGDNGNWYIGDTDTGKPSRGEIGPAGADGTTGADGKSAYAYAVEGGYTGTEEAFAVKLAADIPAVDSTLTKPGQAADAKTVGDALSKISDEVANLQTSGLTTEQVNALDGLFKIVAYTADPASAYSAFKVAFGLDGGGTGVTLSSISATYSGGDVAVGTALSALTGIVVTATYSDGSTATVTGYTLSGEIAEGSNTITVTYQDKTTTFSVTGTAVSQVYTVTNNLTNVTNSNTATSVEAGGSYNATLTVADGNELASLTITMGGVDITDDVYGEGYILITNVTGDIIITAVASALEYVDMATGITTDTVKLYSDAGSTTLATKYYQKSGAYSLNRTESDAKIRVVLTNNTDSAISSSNVYIGSTDSQAIRNPNSSINVHYAISGSKGSVAAGANVEVEYTVRAGYWLYVCGYDSLDVSVIGVLDVHEPTDVLTTTSRAVDSFTVYTDDGSTQIDKATHRTAYATTEAFDMDTPIRLTVVSGGANGGNILYGCTQSGALTANVLAYYGDTAQVRNFATGATIIIDYTVKSGNYFAVMPCSGATIYIEKV